MVGEDNKGENAAAASGPEKPISYMFNPVATGAGQLGITTITFPAQTGRHIRITQTGTDSTYH